MTSLPTLQTLRAQIARIEGANRCREPALPFGLAGLDAHLPGGGLARGALHEIGGSGDGAAATLFTAGIAARLQGPVLWCLTRPDLFAPGLAQVGLPPERVIYLEGGEDKTVLACAEDGLRHGGLAAVVAEVRQLTMTASRRLQLAAEGSGTVGLALRRSRHWTKSADLTQPSAATSRWRVSALPSSPLPVPGIGRHRWQVELLRVRGGEGAVFELEACDDTGRLALPADMADGSAASAGRRIASA